MMMMMIGDDDDFDNLVNRVWEHIEQSILGVCNLKKRF